MQIGEIYLHSLNFGKAQLLYDSSFSTFSCYVQIAKNLWRFLLSLKTLLSQNEDFFNAIKKTKYEANYKRDHFIHREIKCKYISNEF